MCATGKAVIFCLLIFINDPAADDAPAIYQSVPNFSNAIADTGFDISWHVEPREVTLDTEVKLTITFTKVLNPKNVRRPRLNQHSQFAGSFRVIEDKGTEINQRSVTFRYSLRLRAESRDAIPELEIAYFVPGLDRVATKYLEAIPLAVDPTTKPVKSSQPLDLPDRFLTPVMRASHGNQVDFQYWIALLVSVIVAPVIGIIIWRYRNPDGVSLARLKQNDAARNAITGFRQAQVSDEPLKQTVSVLCVYLRDRFHLDIPSPIPSEIGQAMEQCGMERERIQQVVDLIRSCDEKRFSEEQSNQFALLSRFRELIFDWEERM